MTHARTWFSLPGLLAALLFFPGCATPPTASSPTGSTVESGMGTVVARVSLEGLKYVTAFTVVSRPAGSGAKPSEGTSFIGWNMGSDGWFTRSYDAEEKGQMVAVQLPAGEHEFFSYFLVAQDWGGVQSTYTPTQPFAFRFRVEPGKAVYVGNFHVQFLGERKAAVDKGESDMPMGSKRFAIKRTVRDTRARDFADLPKRYPTLDPQRIEVSLAR